MNAFEAAEKNVRAADLQKELEELFASTTKVRMPPPFRQPSCALRSRFEQFLMGD